VRRESRRLKVNHGDEAIIGTDLAPDETQRGGKRPRNPKSDQQAEKQEENPGEVSSIRRQEEEGGRKSEPERIRE